MNRKLPDVKARRKIADLDREYSKRCHLHQALGLGIIVFAILYDFYAMVFRKHYSPGFGGDQFVMVLVGLLIYIINWRRK